MSLITIDQLLESVDLDFEPRWVTKDNAGEIWVWDRKPRCSKYLEQWDSSNHCSWEELISKCLKLAEFENKSWQECIYEVPQKTDEYEQNLEELRPADSDLVYRVKLPRKTTGKIEKLDLSTPNNKMLTDLERIEIKINELVDAVNKHADIIRQIGQWGSSKGEFLWCETLTKFEPDELKGE